MFEEHLATAKTHAILYQFTKSFDSLDQAVIVLGEKRDQLLEDELILLRETIDDIRDQRQQFIDMIHGGELSDVALSAEFPRA